MRGTPRESSTLMNMVDGIFAVAITLIPASLPNQVAPGTGFLLLKSTGAIVLVAFTMLLIWYKLRNVLQINTRILSQESGLLGIVLAVAVLIPKSAFLAIRYGNTEGNFWYWSDAQWINIEYQVLLILVEIIILILTINALRTPHSLRYPKPIRKKLLGAEIVGLFFLTVAILAENLFTGVNGVYVYTAPLILFCEELACIMIMKQAPKPEPIPTDPAGVLPASAKKASGEP